VVDAAARRVDEIVDGAERVASEIIAEAEADAARYLDDRRREVDEVMDEWSADLRGLAELLSRQEDRLRELTESMIAELEEMASVLRRIPPEIDRRQGPETGRGASRKTIPEDRPPRDDESVESPDAGAEPVGGPVAAQAIEPRDPARRPGQESALLRAAQMAVGGSSREEIKRALESELSVSDPGPILDELFGPRD
jgi:hypothetical protein